MIGGTMKRTYPQSLREARELARLTQEELAPLVGMKRAAVSTWEVGRAVPSGSARLMLAATFNLPVEVINRWFTKAA
jgi:DNA-binding transcriptional regulator YiaG